MTLRDRSATLISPTPKSMSSRAIGGRGNGMLWERPVVLHVSETSPVLIQSNLTMDIVSELRRENLQMEIPPARILFSDMAQALHESSAGAGARIRDPRPAKRQYPYTRRMLKLNAAAAAALFFATAGIAVAGLDQVAYLTMLGGLGFSSLAGTMAFRLLRLSLKDARI